MRQCGVLAKLRTFVFIVVQQLRGGEQLGTIFTLYNVQLIEVAFVQFAKLVQTREAVRLEQRRQPLQSTFVSRQPHPHLHSVVSLSERWTRRSRLCTFL